MMCLGIVSFYLYPARHLTSFLSPSVDIFMESGTPKKLLLLQIFFSVLTFHNSKGILDGRLLDITEAFLFVYFLAFLCVFLN